MSGEFWAERVARAHPRLLARSWPAHEGRAAEVAQRQVDELASDPRVLAVIASECSRFAAKRWEEIRRGEGMRL